MHITSDSCPAYEFQVVYETMQEIMSYSCLSNLGSTSLDIDRHMVAILLINVNMFLIIIEVQCLLRIGLGLVQMNKNLSV